MLRHQCVLFILTASQLKTRYFNYSSLLVFSDLQLPSLMLFRNFELRAKAYLPLGQQPSLNADFVSILAQKVGTLLLSLQNSGKRSQQDFITFNIFDHLNWHNYISVYKKEPKQSVLKRLTYTEIGKGIRCTGFLI